MQKIVIDARMISNTGIGTYIRNLIPQLINEFSVTVLGRRNELENFAWFKDVSFIKADFPIYSLKEQWRIPLLIPGKCDLFITPHYNIPVIPIRARKRLVVIHDVNHLVFRDTLSIVQKLYSKLVINSAVRISDSVITVSDFSKKEIVRLTGISADKISVIHLGIDHEKFRSEIHNNLFAEIKQRHSLPGRYFFYAGTFNHHKNLKNLLEAYRSYYLKNSGMDICSLVIAGNINRKHKSTLDILNIINNDPVLRKNVVLTGYVEDNELPLLYSMSTGFVFPSLYEGFGLPPLEAMSCGCPVAASSIPAVKEVCGDAVLYFDPHDTESIAAGLLQIARDDRQRQELILRGFSKAREYTWKDFGNRFVTELKKLL